MDTVGCLTIGTQFWYGLAVYVRLPDMNLQCGGETLTINALQTRTLTATYFLPETEVRIFEGQ